MSPSVKMYVEPPTVNKCCFCFPLRPGIIVFAYINIIFSLLAEACLIFTVEVRRTSLTRESWLEVVTSTVLFSIFGMGLILSILLLVAGYQKDISMLRLYNYYAVATTIAALVPTLVLCSQQMVLEGCAAFLAIVVQLYVTILVRSEVVKLEKQQDKSEEDPPKEFDEDIIDFPLDETLI